MLVSTCQKKNSNLPGAIISDQQDVQSKYYLEKAKLSEDFFKLSEDANESNSSPSM